MKLSVFQRTIVNELGTTLPEASIDVYIAGTTTRPNLFSDPEGTTPITNPFDADINGFAQFYVANGRYDIVANLGGSTSSWDNVEIGRIKKNKIINSRFQHDQEGNMGIQVTDASIVYFADMFFSRNTTGLGAWTPSQIVGGGSRLTIDTAMTDLTTTKHFLGYRHTFEGFNVFDLNSKSITISFKFKAKINGTYSISLISGDALKSYVTDFSYTGSEAYQTITKIITLEAATVDAFDNTIGLFLTIGAQNEADFQTATLDAWQSGIYYKSSSATNYVGTAGNYIEIDKLRFGDGIIDEDIPYDIELLRCQRYVRDLHQRFCENYYYLSSILYFNIPLSSLREASSSLVTGIEATDWQIFTKAGVAQTGFVLSNGGVINGSLVVIATKTTHGLNDAVLKFITANKNIITARL